MKCDAMMLGRKPKTINFNLRGLGEMEKSIFTIIEVYDETFSYHSASSHKDRE